MYVSKWNMRLIEYVSDYVEAENLVYNNIIRQGSTAASTYTKEITYNTDLQGIIPGTIIILMPLIGKAQ